MTEVKITDDGEVQEPRDNSDPGQEHRDTMAAGSSSKVRREELEASVDVQGQDEAQSGYEWNEGATTSSPTPEQMQGDVKPFRSPGEMTEAMADPKYDTDKDYRLEVDARVAASMSSSETAIGNEVGGSFKDDNKGDSLARQQARREALKNPASEAKIPMSDSSEGPEPFATQEEVLDRMDDPRYKTDKNYRQWVDSRIAVSDVL